MSSLDSIPGVKSHLNCGNLAPDNEDIDAILVANVNSGGIIKTPAVNRSDQNSKADKRFIWHVLHATKTLISYQDLQGKLNVLFTGCGTALSAQISNCLTSMGSQAMGLDAYASRVKCPARFVSHLHEIFIYIWVVYSFCLFCCLFIIVTWWYMWCIVWQVASKRKYRHVWLPYGYLLYHATVYTKPL